MTRLDEQGDAEFGVLAAQELIDIVAHYVGPETYNNGIEDAKRAAETRLADLEVELDILKVTP